MNVLQKIWQAWQKFGRFVGNLVGRIILSIFYFTIMLPFGLGVTLFGDALKLKEKTSRHWILRAPVTDGLDQASRQF